jgi:hypothetical protein
MFPVRCELNSYYIEEVSFSRIYPLLLNLYMKNDKRPELALNNRYNINMEALQDTLHII